MNNKPDRILVVDDEAVIRELLYDVLADEGFEVELAPNGRVALERIEEDPSFVLLFTDIMMPEVDGIELIHEARKIRPDLVSIVMTGYATIETARAAVKEGAYDYVLKPFNLSEIKLAIHNALERRRLAMENMRLQELTELFHISENIASVRDERELFNFVLNAALERVSAVRGSLMIVTEDGQQLRVASSRGLPHHLMDSVVDIGDTISGLVARDVRPLLVQDIRDAPSVQKRSQHLKGVSFISVPLERKGTADAYTSGIGSSYPRVLAVLNVTEKADGSNFTESDLKVLSIIANHSAAALENVRLFRDLEDTQREIVYTLGEIVETRSKETGHHVKRVAEYSRLLAEKYGLPAYEAEIIRLASPLHDVGKVGIPDAILNKPGKLDPAEFDVIKTHTTVGFDMLRGSRGRMLQAAAILAHQHHERWDGAGYPQGLVGDETHLYGRITGIVDVFDALGQKRLYKEAWPAQKILDYFCNERGRQFDPALVDIFFNNLDAILEIKAEFPADY